MPTENRCSNTDQPQIEAASAAMAQIRTMLGREQRPDQVAAALEACDWSGSPIGNKAIILSAIQVLRTIQPHPEPIAWTVGTAFWWTKEEAERDAAETGLPIVGLGPMTGAAPAERQQGEPVAWLAKTLKGSLAGTLGLARYDQRLNPELYDGPFPVFRHADPGEVERVKAEHRKHAAELIASRGLIREERDALRAQLAERDALLRELLADDVPLRLAAKIETALSARAEPSAAIEIDHDALVAAVCVLRSQGLGNLSAAVEEARIALDRNPS